MDRDLGPLRELLGALLTASCSLSSPFACSSLLRTPFLLALDPFGSKADHPAGVRSSEVQWFCAELQCFAHINMFDVEVVFLFPWAVVFKEMGLLALIEMGIFLLILCAGLAYVWVKSDLEWVRRRI